MTTELPTEQKIQQIYEKVSKARSSGSIRELVYMQIDGKIYELVRAMSWGGLQGHQWPYARKRISDMLLKFTGAEFDIETVRDVLESFQNPKTNSPFDKAVLDMAYNVLLDTLEIQTTEHTHSVCAMKSQLYWRLIFLVYRFIKTNIITCHMMMNLFQPS